MVGEPLQVKQLSLNHVCKIGLSEANGAGQPLAEGAGGGGPKSDDWRESLALYLLCGLVFKLV
jgi:hypothetical protein